MGMRTRKQRLTLEQRQHNVAHLVEPARAAMAARDQDALNAIFEQLHIRDAKALVGLVMSGPDQPLVGALLAGPNHPELPPATASPREPLTAVAPTEQVPEFTQEQTATILATVRLVEQTGITDLELGRLPGLPRFSARFTCDGQEVQVLDQTDPASTFRSVAHAILALIDCPQCGKSRYSAAWAHPDPDWWCLWAIRSDNQWVPVSHP